MKNVPTWLMSVANAILPNTSSEVLKVEDTEDPITADTVIDRIRISPDDKTEMFTDEDGVAWFI